MKVLHVTDIIAPRYGGLSTAILNICQGLAEQGVQVDLIATDRDFPDGKIARKGVNPHFHNGFFQSLYPVLWRPLGYSPNMARFLDRCVRNYDLIHIHGLYRYAHYIAAKYARRNGIPYIISPHGALDPYLFYKQERRWIKRLYEMAIEARNLKRASAIHYTACDEKLLAENLGLYKTPGFVVPNGIDVEKFEKLPKSGTFRQKWKLKEGPVVLFSGRISESKGVNLLIKAFHRLSKNRPHIQLVLAGPDNDNHWRRCLALVKELGLEKTVFFVGMLHIDELMEAYVDADLLALPSYSENFGMVIVEAMLCGTPVLISDKVKIWRDIIAENAGVVVSCDVESISSSLIDLFRDENKLLQLGSNAKPAAEKLYSRKIVMQNLLEQYQKFIAIKHVKHKNKGRKCSALNEC